MKTNDTIAIKRQRLINEINRSEDEKLLDKLYQYFLGENELQEEYVLSEAQESVIKRAQKQIQNGEFLTNEQAEKDIQGWFDK